MASFIKMLDNIIKSCTPDPKKAGKTLLVINAMGMVFAALSNTYAAAVDKNTSAEDKKFLVPAGFVTGAANIGLYYAMTQKIIDKLYAFLYTVTIIILKGELQSGRSYTIVDLTQCFR